jgi:hypothetical protein
MTTERNTQHDKAIDHAFLADRMLKDLQTLKNDLPPDSVILPTIEACYGILQTIYVQTQRELELAQRKGQ